MLSRYKIVYIIVCVGAVMFYLRLWYKMLIPQTEGHHVDRGLGFAVATLVSAPVLILFSAIEMYNAYSLKRKDIFYINVTTLSVVLLHLLGLLAALFF
jgi:hypothetical protein